MRRVLLRVAALTLAAACTAPLAACSDDTQDKIDDAADAVREDAEDAIGEGSAVALAEAFGPRSKPRRRPTATSRSSTST